MATGAAHACKELKNGFICVCLFGDGASNRGTFHESLNLASIWKLPVVFICENNEFAVTTARKDTMNIDDVSCRAVGYGITGIKEDGNDVIKVYEAALKAADIARRGDGPVLLEYKTWRQRGHFEGDPQSYKDPKDQEAWMGRDPVINFGKELIDNGYATQAELGAITEKLRVEVDEAFAVAFAAPYPELSELMTDVYA